MMINMKLRVTRIQFKDIFNVLYLRRPLFILQYSFPICIAFFSKLYFKKGIRRYECISSVMGMDPVLVGCLFRLTCARPRFSLSSFSVELRMSQA